LLGLLHPGLRRSSLPLIGWGRLTNNLNPRIIQLGVKIYF
jgi:hypothetical protein